MNTRNGRGAVLSARAPRNSASRRYIEDWRLKIERIGELNYPQAARDQKIYGSLVLDGIDQGRRHARQDRDQPLLGPQGSRRGCDPYRQLAAPSRRFPRILRKDTDILSITRTWTFTRADNSLAK